MSCGTEHTLALTANGKVYAWGSNQYGVLGVGNHFPFTEQPSLVEKLERQTVVQISAGDKHSLFLTAQGTVMATGKGTIG